MSKLKFSRRSQRDLNEIWDRIAEDDRPAGERFTEAIRQKCRLLADNPRMVRARDELRQGLRSFPVGRFLIFYRQLDQGIVVVRVAHGAREIGALFRS
jgi:toxin ParE1/3/4